MDSEAQTHAGACDSALSSPLIRGPSVYSSPAKPPRASWLNDQISRQSSARSTVASSADFNLPPAYSPALPPRLQMLQERRSWWYLARSRMAVPAALVVGMVLGAAAVVVLTEASAQAPAPVPAAVAAPYAMAVPPSQVPLEYMVSPALNNSCLIPHLAIPGGPQTFDACGFVVRSTDEVWNLRGDVDAAIDKYFHEDYVDAGSWGRRIIGKKALREAIFSEMRAFPDIRIHITDCVCRGNDNDGYKCAMPDVLTGTNIGPSAYGPATGRYARWTGLVQSLVKRNVKTGQWQYVAEWGVHDEWALIQQLGLDFTRVPHPPINSEATHDCMPLLQFTPAPALDADDAAMKDAHDRVKAMGLQ